MVSDKIQSNTAYIESVERVSSNNFNISNQPSYKEILQATKEQAQTTIEEYTENLHKKIHSLVDNEPEDFWTLRHKRMKKRLEMEQEMFDHIYELKQLSNHKAEIKSAQMKAEGLVDTSNPMPVITGVPAKYLLSMLTAGD